MRFFRPPRECVVSLQTDARAGLWLWILWGDILFLLYSTPGFWFGNVLDGPWEWGGREFNSHSLLYWQQSPVGSQPYGMERPLSDFPPWLIPKLCLQGSLPYDAINTHGQGCPAWQMSSRHKSASAYHPHLDSHLNSVLGLNVSYFLVQ